MPGLTDRSSARISSSSIDANEGMGSASAISPTAFDPNSQSAMEAERGDDHSRGVRDEACNAPSTAGGRGPNSNSSSTQAPEHALHSSPAADAAADADVVYPVLCEDCGTQVGGLDANDVYHFFNVLPSNA